MDPLFVIGANRSGTSLMTSLLSQHPEIEGIFKSDDIEVKNNHTLPYCDTPDELWNVHPNTFSSHLWALPKHISTVYQEPTVEEGIKLSFNAALDKYRKTDKIPLIKKPKCSLQIGLIKSVHPDAKFILMIRNIETYVVSCVHNWGEHADDVKMHWHNIYSVALQDLKRYADGDYAIVNYEQLLNENSAAGMMDNLHGFIGVEPYDNQSLDIIDTKYKFSGTDTECVEPLEKWYHLLTEIK